MSAKAAIKQPPLCILIAEDEPNDVLLLKRAFAKSGVRANLSFVGNGLEAINYLRGDPPYDDRVVYPLPQLLLLDLNMPGAGGLEVLEWLAHNPHRAVVPTVIFSSCVAPEASRMAARLGARLCITKPLDPLELIPLLKDLPSFPGLDHLA
jgi:CheY-like chemotaxis protein